ncbi:hypothetical protein C9374_003005 [Naegleria lovaniensis]|uniref:Uncharacterized protein n=1 Tax=Naegleria lovaniensis TaxID=51637 RepID=A0AA88KLZ0_NAELO|nr:uncharacterized protein C9374_003005 [Naegleria lovaniensis]KAG2385856.1 hypothetical protein C9374_003005 [Naegleria lovaniensis]
MSATRTSLVKPSTASSGMSRKGGYINVDASKATAPSSLNSAAACSSNNNAKRPLSQPMRHYKKSTNSSNPTLSSNKQQAPPSTASSVSAGAAKRKVSSPTTPTQKAATNSDNGLHHQDYPTLYRRVSLKDEKAVLLNEEELHHEFERQKRRLERLAQLMKLPSIDVEYFINTYGTEYSTTNLHQLSTVVDLLEKHKRRTIEVTEAIRHREEIIEQLCCLIDDFHNLKENNPGILLFVQREALVLQKTLQHIGTKVVELIDKWRKDLSLDYPFRFKEHSNYLLKMRYDLEFVDYSEIAPYIFPFKGHPLLGNVPSLYYESIDKMLEVQDKKNPSLTSTVTYPLTKQKLKMADAATSAERKLTKFEAIILKEEENEKATKHFLFTLIKKGKFISVLNVEEGEFDLSLEQQLKIRNIFTDNPEHVVSFFGLSGKLSVTHQISSHQLVTLDKTDTLSEDTTKSDKLVLPDNTQQHNEGNNVNENNGYTSDGTDDAIEYIVLNHSRRHESNGHLKTDEPSFNQHHYDGSGEESEKEPIKRTDVGNSTTQQLSLAEISSISNPYLEDQNDPSNTSDTHQIADLSRIEKVAELCNDSIEPVLLAEEQPLETHKCQHMNDTVYSHLGTPHEPNNEVYPPSPKYSERTEESVDPSQNNHFDDFSFSYTNPYDEFSPKPSHSETSQPSNQTTVQSSTTPLQSPPSQQYSHASRSSSFSSIQSDFDEAA